MHGTLKKGFFNFLFSRAELFSRAAQQKEAGNKNEIIFYNIIAQLTSKSGPPWARQLNAVLKAFRWRADGGPTLYAGWVFGTLHSFRFKVENPGLHLYIYSGVILNNIVNKHFVIRVGNR